MNGTVASSEGVCRLQVGIASAARRALHLARRNAYELGSLAVLCAVFWRHLYVTFTRPSDEYEILVSYITLYLVWDNRRALGETGRKGRAWAIAPLLAILCVTAFASPAMIGTNAVLFTFAVIGWILLYLGWSHLRILAFPLAFYFFNLFLFQKISSFLDLGLSLRLASTQVASAFLSLLGETPEVRGTQLSIQDFSSSVDPVCSGLNNLFSFLIVGSLIAYYVRTSLARRTALFASAVPLAVLANGLRVAALVILCRTFGSTFEAGFWHSAVGVATFALCLGFYPLLIEVAACGKKR